LPPTAKSTYMRSNLNGKDINVCISFDKSYITPFYVLLTSIFVNNKQNSLTIHVIATGLTQDEIEGIVSYVNHNGNKIIFYNIEEDFAKDLKINKAWSRAIYYRLLFPALLPIEIDKFIYIDTDTVVVGDLAEFDKVDIGKCVLGAVCDAGGKSQVRPELGIFNENSYFNSGVLLINKRAWIEQDITNKTIGYLFDNSESIIFPDQDALNAVLINNWKEIGSRFNLVTAAIPDHIKKSKFKNYLEDKIVIHYTTHLKPWSIFCENRFRYLFYFYLNISPKSKEPKYHDYHLRFTHPKGYIKARLKEWHLNYIGPIRKL
jgi:lipopolysaccharide biosynthesis glycosyltransferase